MSKKPDELLNSNYDGIQEYDNDLPRWWLWLFILTILFGGVYVVAFHVVSDESSEERLAAEIAAIKEKSANVPTAIQPVNLMEFVKDSARLANGKGVYLSKCAACHGPEGQGVVGPNLTDNYWIHGGKIEDIRHTVEVGVPEKGMLAWKGLMASNEIDDVSIYIFSLRGTNPANPKAPQGEPMPSS